MKKYFYTMAVIAIFAIGFAASGEDEDEVRYSFGRKYHKVHLKCVNCGGETYYWEADDGSGSISKPSDGHFRNGNYYCGSAMRNCFPPD